MEKEPGDGETAQDGGREDSEGLDSIQDAASAAVTAGMETLRTEVKSDLWELRKCFRH